MIGETSKAIYLKITVSTMCHFCVNDTKRKCPLKWYTLCTMSHEFSIQEFKIQIQCLFAENERNFFWVMFLFEFMNSIGNVNHVMYASNAFGHCFQMKSILVSEKEQKKMPQQMSSSNREPNKVMLRYFPSSKKMKKKSSSRRKTSRSSRKKPIGDRKINEIRVVEQNTTEAIHYNFIYQCDC